tara:strand:- start:1140 stop:1871 length:732 start_codon:yes stop_codon:yes gene_type:complete
MFKIDSEKELLSFLRILSEESVKKSKYALSEKSSDELASSFDKRLKKEEELYEQEDDTDPELSAGDTAEEEEVEEEEVEEEEEAKEPEAEEAQAKPDEELRASLDSLERNINSLRAGRSLKDSTIESQLEIYFDRLGEDEKSLMVLFIRELSKILSGKVTGDNAVDPNQEPYNLDVIQSNDEEPEPEINQEEPAAEPEETSIPEEEEEEEEEEEGEDSSPPIQVGKKQNLAEIRRKIKKLMRS